MNKLNVLQRVGGRVIRWQRCPCLPPLTSAPWPTLLSELLPRHFLGSYTSRQAVWAAILAARSPVLGIPSYQLTLKGKQGGGEFSALAPKLSGIPWGRASLLNLNLVIGLCSED